MQQDNLPDWYGGVQTPPEYLRAGFGIRFGAWIIDFVLTMILMTGVAGVLMALKLQPPEVSPEVYKLLEEMQVFTSGMDTTGFVNYMMFLTLVAPACVLAYTFIEALGGKSPGKLVLGLEIAHPDGTRGNTRLWMRRWAVKHLDVVLGFIALLPALGAIDTISGFIKLVIALGYLGVLGESRLALHDRIAQTAVFYRTDIRP